MNSTKTIIKNSMFGIILISIFVLSKNASSQCKDIGEIIPAVCNLPSEYTDKDWTCSFQAKSSIRWADNNMITSNYYSGMVTGTGNNQASEGFDAPDSHD